MPASLAFEPHQFADRRQYPVHADYTSSGEFVSTGIAFEDYERMSTQTHKPSAERRLPTPDWAVHDGKLRELLVNHLELRAGFRHVQPGTQPERLARAVARLKESAPEKITIIKRLCHEYTTIKRSNPRDTRLRELQIQIENLDTQLRLINRPAELLIGIVYHYYRQRLDSVGTALALGIKPPMVRATIWRLNRTWSRMQAGTLWLSAPKTRRHRRAV